MDEGQAKVFDVLHLFQLLLHLGVMVLLTTGLHEVYQKTYSRTEVSAVPRCYFLHEVFKY